MSNRSIVENTTYQALGKFGSAIFMFGATLLLARLLGKADFGQFTTIITYLSLFYMGVDLGLNQVFLHLTGVQAEKKYAQFFLLRITLGLFVSLVAILGMLFLIKLRASYTAVEIIGVIIGVFMIAAYAITLTTSVLFQKQRRFDLFGWAQGIGSLVTFLGIVFWVNFHFQGRWGILVGVGWWTIGALFTAFLSISLAKVISFPKNIDLGFWKVLLERGAPLAIALLFNSAYLRWGILGLSWMRTSGEVGQYGLSFKFFEVALTLPIFFMNSYYPDLLEKAATQKWESIKKLILVLFLGSIAIGSILFFSAPLLSLVRSDFDQSPSYLRALSLLVPVFFMSSPLVWYFVITKKQNVLAILYAIAFFIHILIVPSFVVMYGVYGAIAALGLTELTILLMGWGVLRKNSVYE